jgi:hypothetical protein
MEPHDEVLDVRRHGGPATPGVFALVQFKKLVSLSLRTDAEG